MLILHTKQICSPALATVIGQKSVVHPTAKLHDWVMLGDDVVVGAHTTIDEGSIVHTNGKIANDCKIGKFCELFLNVTMAASATLMDQIKLGVGTNLMDSSSVGTRSLLNWNNNVHEYALIGENVQTKANADFGAYSIVGDNSNVGVCACVEKGATVPENSQIADRGAFTVDGIMLGTPAQQQQRYDLDTNTGKCVLTSNDKRQCDSSVPSYRVRF